MVFSAFLLTSEHLFSISFVTSCTFEWVKPLSHVWLFATPWTVAHQAPLSMGFSRQEYWSGLPFHEVCQNSVLGLLFFSIHFPLVTDGTPIASDTITVLFDLNPDLRPYLPVLWTGYLHLGIALGISHCLCKTELTDHLYILLEVFSYTSVICVVTQTSYVVELEFSSPSVCIAHHSLWCPTHWSPNPLHPCWVHGSLKLLLFVCLFIYSFNSP